MPETYESAEIITIYPFDEGFAAHEAGKSIHDNPYKSPNTPKTDDVKSESWLKGFESSHDTHR